MNIPDEDLDNMLDELKDTIRTLKLSWNAIKDIEEKNGKTIRDVMPSITWVDNNENNTLLKINKEEIIIRYKK